MCEECTLPGDRYLASTQRCHVPVPRQQIKPYIMTQDERWNLRYQEVMDFIETNHRNPSKHRIEEHDMLNWVKQQRKLHNAGKLNLNRVEAFKKLMALIEENKRVNQYK